MVQAQIFIDKDELRGERPLYEFILLFLLEKNIAGATAFNGFMGFGKHQKLKRPNREFSFDETPLVISFVDTKENVEEAIKELRNVYSGGLIITHAVEQW